MLEYPHTSALAPAGQAEILPCIRSHRKAGNIQGDWARQGELLIA
jgi:hypothetical protein